MYVCKICGFLIAEQRHEGIIDLVTYSWKHAEKNNLLFSYGIKTTSLGVDGLENCRDLKVKSSIAEVTVNVGSYYWKKSVYC